MGEVKLEGKNRLDRVNLDNLGQKVTKLRKPGKSPSPSLDIVLCVEDLLR